MQTPKAGLSRCLLLVCACATLAPGVVSAQAPARTWDGFVSLVEPGQAIRVTDRTGQRWTGRLVAATTSGLEFVGDGNRRETLSGADIVRVVGKDSNVNGMVLGLLAGVAGGFSITAAMCGDSDNRYFKCDALVPIAASVGAGVGFVTGLTIDASHWRDRTLYEPERPQTVSLAVAPIVNRRVLGSILIVRWR